MTTALFFSHQHSITAAISEIWTQLKPKLEPNSPSILILYTNTPEADHSEFTDHLKKAAPDSYVIGCSTAGISDYRSSKYTTAIIAIQSPDVTFKTAVVSHISKKNPQTATKLLQAIHQNTPPKLLMMFTDGLNTGTQDLLNQMKDKQLHLCGVAAGDNNQYKATYQYFEKQAVQDSAAVIGFFGNLQVVSTSIHPYQQITENVPITKARDNVITEIDHKPANQYFQEIFSQELFNTPNNNIPDMLSTYPIQITPPSSQPPFLTQVLAFKNGEVTTSFTIPQASQIALTTSRKQAIIQQAQTKIKELSALLKGKQAQLIITSSSPSHIKLILDQSPTILDIVKEEFGEDIPVIQTSTYGQISTEPKTKFSQLLTASTQITIFT